MTSLRRHLICQQLIYGQMRSAKTEKIIAACIEAEEQLKHKL